MSVRGSRVGLLALVLIVCSAAGAWAETVALEYKTAPDVATIGRARQAAKQLAGPPNYLKGRPTLVSRKPLYFEAKLGPEATPFLFVLDESNGTGKGFDLLYLDANGDRDLSNDPPVKGACRASLRATEARFAGLRALVRCGQQTLPWTFSAVFSTRQVTWFSSALGTWETTERSLRVMSAGYCEGTLEVRGKRLRVAVVDADSNGCFNDYVTVAKGSGGGRLSSSGGDWVLIDADGDGQYANELAALEALAYGRYVLLDGRCYELQVAASGRSLTLSPSTAPLGSLSRAGGGAFVASLLTPSDGMLYVRSAGGPVPVPAGRYRLFGCVFEAKDRTGALWQAEGRGTWEAPPIQVAAGQTTVAKFGPPLNVGVIATTLGGHPLDSLKPGASVWLGLSITGRGGETYSASEITREGKRLTPPTFKVVSPTGDTVVAGDFRYG